MRTPASLLLVISTVLCAALLGGCPESPNRRPVGPEAPPECPVCRAAQQAGEVMVPARWPIVIRGHPPYETAQIAFPRGRMRVGDLDYAWIRLGLEVSDPGRMDLVYRWDGGGEARLSLGSVEFVDSHPVLPSDARRAFSAPGTHVTVSVVSDQGTHAESALHVVDSDPRVVGRLARIAEQLSGEPAWVRALVRARILLDGGLHAAACREVDAVLREHPKERHACALRLAVLTAAGLSTESREAEIWLDAARPVTELLLSPPPDVSCRALEYGAPDPAWPEHERGVRWHDTDPRPTGK